MIPTSGFLRLHVLAADLTHKTGGMMHKMNPYIDIHVGQLQNWRSLTCRDGGKEPRWNGQFMDIEVRHIGQMIDIVCRDDHDDKPIIGGVQLPI